MTEIQIILITLTGLTPAILYTIFMIALKEYRKKIQYDINLYKSKLLNAIIVTVLDTLYTDPVDGYSNYVKLCSLQLQASSVANNETLQLIDTILPNIKAIEDYKVLLTKVQRYNLVDRLVYQELEDKLDLYNQSLCFFEEFTWKSRLINSFNENLEP